MIKMENLSERNYSIKFLLFSSVVFEKLLGLKFAITGEPVHESRNDALGPDHDINTNQDVEIEDVIEEDEEGKIRSYNEMMRFLSYFIPVCWHSGLCISIWDPKRCMHFSWIFHLSEYLDQSQKWLSSQESLYKASGVQVPTWLWVVY